jgi:hypothetical protein
MLVIVSSDEASHQIIFVFVKELLKGKRLILVQRKVIQDHSLSNKIFEIYFFAEDGFNNLKSLPTIKHVVS